MSVKEAQREQFESILGILLVANSEPELFLHLESVFPGKATLDGLRDIYGLLLGRGPDLTALDAYLSMERPLAEIAHIVLNSHEFMERLPLRILQFRSDMIRYFYLHVYKTAGSWAIAHFGRGPEPWWDSVFEDSTYPIVRRWEVASDFLTRALDESNARIWVTGHRPLSYYWQQKLVRDRDVVFMTIRDPREIVISQVNYMFTTIQDVPDHAMVNTWTSWLDGASGLVRHAAPRSPEAARVAEEWLRCPAFDVEYSRPISRSIGSHPFHLRSVLDLLLQANVHVLRPKDVIPYFRSLGLPASQMPPKGRVNVSKQVITYEDLAPGTQLVRLPALIGDDEPLMRHFARPRGSINQWLHYWKPS